MNIRLVGQPFTDALNLYDFVSSVAEPCDGGWLRIGVAWAKRSGLIRVEGLLRRFRQGGGKITAIVGISEGGATRQGLESILALCDEGYIFHDRHRTFHPKCYLFVNGERAEVFLGSNNLTAGGLFWNYELAVQISLDLNNTEDAAFYSEIDSWFEKLIMEPSVCKRLDVSFLAHLLSSSLYSIGDEDRGAGADQLDDSEIDETGDEALRDTGGAEVLFGKSTRGKRADPYRSKNAGGAAKQPLSGSSGADFPAVVRWYKKLSASDAQQPKTANSNITGNLKLTKAGHAIDQKVYFRHELFAHEKWSSVKRPRGVLELAAISFQVVIRGTSHGIQELTVDHAEFRVAAQNNVPTWLHWNDDMNLYLRTHNHVGDFVTLERDLEGMWRLVIDNTPAG